MDFEVLKKSISDAASLDTDLIEASYVLACCAFCATIRGRVFSISGKTKKYPKLPDLSQCECQGLQFYPFIDDIDELSVGNYDPVTYSNRPFVDDRSAQEREDYAWYIREQKNEEKYAEYISEYEKINQIIRAKNHAEYDIICKLIPDSAPKSYSGYMRMKKGNTANYQKLVEKMKQAGIVVYYPDSKLTQRLDELKPYMDAYYSEKRACLEHYERRKLESNL